MSSDTSAIDDKKQQTTSVNENFISEVSNFALWTVVAILCGFAYFGSGGLILYACKVAQSNILPTECNCFPYEDAKPIITPTEDKKYPIGTNPISINIFPQDKKSMKIQFEYAENALINPFQFLNAYKSNFILHYFISIIEELACFNYTILNFILNKMNSLPEFITVMFGPLMLGIMAIIILLMDNFFIIYLFFAKMGWFFAVNANDTNKGKPQWSTASITSPLRFALGIWLVVINVVCLFFGFAFTPLISTFTFMVCLFHIFSCKGKMTEKEKLTDVSSLTIAGDTFLYYKFYIMCVLSICIISIAFSTLGPILGIFSIITVIAIYFGIIRIDMFITKAEENLTDISSYKQATKECAFRSQPEQKPGGMLETLYHKVLGIFNTSQKGGGHPRDNIATSPKIKHILKKLKL